jgi:hypothetical protein
MRVSRFITSSGRWRSCPACSRARRRAHRVTHRGTPTRAKACRTCRRTRSRRRAGRSRLRELDAVVDHAPYCVARREQCAADPAHILAQLAHAPADDLRRLVRDAVLELVDLVVECVEEVEIALRDVVDEVVDVHADLFVVAAREFRRLRIERCLTRRCLRHGNERVERRDEVDLLVVQPVFVRYGDGEQEHAEDVIVVRLDLRPWLIVVHMRREQHVERDLVHVLGQHAIEIACARVDQVDPLGHAAEATRGVGRLSASGSR